jgi:uncharacterized membrane protein YgcG
MRSLGRCGWATILVVLLALPARTARPRPDERILSYHSDITVHEDATLLVTEIIRVRSAGARILHGIYRDFPTRYQGRWGRNYQVGFALVYALRDDQPEAHHLESLQDGVRVYLGKKEVTLPPGEYTYEITYRVTRELGFFPDHDELYWNVTGNGWVFPIDEVSATVYLPASVPRSQVKLDGYIGRKGSQEKDFSASLDSAGNAAFTGTRPLGPSEGLSVVVGWPKGYIAAPTARTRFQYFLEDNRADAFVLGGLAVVLLYYLVVWWRVGRDPAPGTIVPLYEPPPGLSPAAVRYLTQMGFDNKAFAAAVIDMAVKKKLTIQQEAGKYTITPTAGAGQDSDLPLEERALKKKLLADDSPVCLESKNYKTISGALDSLKHALHDQVEQIYFVSNSRYFVPGVLLTALTVALALFFSGQNWHWAGALFMGVWLTGWTTGVGMLLLNASRLWKKAGGGIPQLLAAVFMTLFTLPFIGGELFALSALAGMTSPLLVLTVAALVSLSFIFHYLLKAPTRAGRRVLDKLDGFRMFLAATEEDRLNRLNPPNKTPELFEKYLPYALALGVEQAWSAQFASALAQAGQAPQQYSPSWYSGQSLGDFSSFATSFSDSFSGAVASASSPPGSSSGFGGGGGGGGGGSGGGGGGGGGGGW